MSSADVEEHDGCDEEYLSVKVYIEDHYVDLWYAEEGRNYHLGFEKID